MIFKEVIYRYLCFRTRFDFWFYCYWHKIYIRNYYSDVNYCNCYFWKLISTFILSMIFWLLFLWWRFLYVKWCDKIFEINIFDITFLTEYYCNNFSWDSFEAYQKTSFQYNRIFLKYDIYFKVYFQNTMFAFKLCW